MLKRYIHTSEALHAAEVVVTLVSESSRWDGGTTLARRQPPLRHLPCLICTRNLLFDLIRSGPVAVTLNHRVTEGH